MIKPIRSFRFRSKPVRAALTIAVAAAQMLSFALPAFAAPVAGNLVISRSVYDAAPSLITVGQSLPGGGKAVSDAGLPEVWNNEAPDGSFGITTPIYLDLFNASEGGVSAVLNTITVSTGQLVTSFSSKSEMALNLSTDGHWLTFMGYVAPDNTLDVSNSNTPNHVDPTNPVAGVYQRAIAQFDPTLATTAIQVTPVDTYSGNNGRAAIFDVNNNQYLTVGNAGNGSGTEPVNIVNNTGVQSAIPGGSAETTVIGVQQGTPGAKNGFQYGFSITQVTNTSDKSGKDDNFRGIALYNNTLYVSKGSGSNGVNTVYQVGSSGTTPTAGTASTTAINVLPGFSTTLASAKTPAVIMNPFGLWFANSTTLYVADEGNGSAVNPNAGIQKWVYENDGNWHNVYTLQNGLRGVGYTVTSADNSTSVSPTNDGLRSLTGIPNTDGTVTLFGATSTISTETDQGADPNSIVSINDNLSFMTASAATSEMFTTVVPPAWGQVMRGVAFVPLSSDFSSVISGLVYNRRTATFNGTIQITNTSGMTISGPIQLELQNLSAGVMLVDGTGSDNGNPYITATVNNMNPGDTVTVPVSFSDPTRTPINYTVALYSGSF